MRKRIAIAIGFAGLTEKQARKQLPKRIRPAANLRMCLYTPDRLVALAKVCGVDVRWLVTGRGSPAGLAVLQMFKRAVLIAAADAKIALLTPQPVLQSGVCCYCGCSHFNPCDMGCGWVDAEQTICTACLDPDGQKGNV